MSDRIRVTRRYAPYSRRPPAARRLNFTTDIVPYVGNAAPLAAATYVPVPVKGRKRTSRKRGDWIPRGCVGPCKVQDYEFKMDVPHGGTFVCVSDFTRGTGLTHRLGKRVCIKSMGVSGKVWMDDNIAKKDHTNIITFWLVRDRRPNKDPLTFSQLFHMFDNEPLTAKVRTDLRDRFQVLRRFSVTVTGGPYAHKEQAQVRRFFKGINNHVTYNHKEEAKYENQLENAMLMYSASSHASNPVYQSLRIRAYFYDSHLN
ncbi:AV1 [Calystegia hederacea geminiviridae]|nr:AV1 [Calystegia hederacea geminiviridae]WMX25046.1 AV1 [Sweet potato leaf curl Hubei virus]